jgi:putative phage head-tail adaptor
MIETMQERIIIQKSIPVNAGDGNHKLLWEDYYSCYSYVNNLSGNEYWAAAQVNSQVDLNFIIRYCSEVSHLDGEHYRIIFRNQFYNIKFVDNVQYKNKSLKLRASLVKR